MAYADLPAFTARLNERTEIASKALAFTILTACRTNEVLSATWAEIDWEARTWMTPPAASNECRSANLLRPCSIIWQASASTNSCSPRSTHARAGLCRTWHSPRCCGAWAKEASPSMASARPFAIGAAKKLGVSEAAECAAPHSCTPDPGQPISETFRITERQRNTIHEAVEQIVGPFGCFLIADAEPADPSI
jgi:hypothetical protein